MIRKPILIILALSVRLHADDFTRLLEYMEGSFSSRRQALTDSDFSDVRLHMARIWENRDDGAWLYVEQAYADLQEKPYRQRIYRITALGDGRFCSTVFTFDEADRFIGAWREPQRFDVLTPHELHLREGCEVILNAREDGSFSGSTIERRCRSVHRGAAYAMSEMALTERHLITWERGFDEEGNQVWGPVKGPYQFDKEEER